LVSIQPPVLKPRCRDPLETLKLIAFPYAALGLGVGLLVGVTGVGGGSLMTPLLILLFGIHPVTAVGTDLLFAAATKSVGTLVNGLHCAVAWRVTGLLAAASLPAAGATLALVSRMGPHHHAASIMIRAVVAAVLLLTALSLVARRHIISLAQARLLDVGPRGSARRAVDAAHGSRALDHGLGGLAPARLAAGRLGAGHRGRQLRQRPRPRAPAARGAGGDADRRRGEDRLVGPYRKRLILGSGVVTGPSRNQAGDECAEQGFAASARIVHELEEAKIKGQLVLRDAAVRAQPGA